jgi:DNA-binding beta-propeller fold protein YncE
MKTLLAFFALGALAFGADAPGFKVAQRFAVPGDGGFDYVTYDASSNRVYASHGTEVDVLDASSGKLLGKVEDTPGVHGIAIVPGLHRGFTTNGGESMVSVFDTNTFKTIKKIAVDKDPDFVFYDPSTKRVLVCHGDAAAITAIDPEKESVIGKVGLGGGAEASVVNGKGTGFVNLEEEAEVVAYDPQALTVKAKYPITGCKTPTGLAMDTVNSRLFIGCRSKVMAVMNADTGSVITTLPIGTRVDAVTFDADNKLIFCSNGDGTISVIRQKTPDEYESVGDIRTQESAKTMALDPKSKRMFLSAAEIVPPPAGTKGRGKPKPGSFTILVVERQ